MMSLESLSAFIAIATTRSFTDAARQLALSKSVVSERLKELEPAHDAARRSDT
jgi:DNA-binding transcriptional LysR family regulator